MHEQGYSTEEIIKAVGKTNKFCVESLIERSKAVPKPRYLAPSSVKLYFSTINTMLNKAVKNGFRTPG